MISKRYPTATQALLFNVTNKQQRALSEQPALARNGSLIELAGQTHFNTPQ